MSEKRKTAREMAHRYIENNDPLGWFDALYERAGGEPDIIPWADMAPNPNLLEWLDAHPLPGTRPSALEIGCGLGDNAEALSRRGFQVTAFDISETAIQWAMKRFPRSPVSYAVQDLFQPPASWLGAFDMVLESYTLQVLPPELRPQAIAAISRFVAPAGILLVICRGREDGEYMGKMPWPLTGQELVFFDGNGLERMEFDDYVDSEDPPVRRFRAVYRRPSSTP
jgi:SAM-dependent methyltransferase